MSLSNCLLLLLSCCNQWCSLVDCCCLIKGCFLIWNNTSHILQINLLSKIHLSLFNISWFVWRLLFCTDIVVISSLSLCCGICYSTFEVKDVCFYCTERIIVTHIEPICVLSLTGLWFFFNNWNSLSIRLCSRFLFDFLWRFCWLSSFNKLSFNRLSLIKI